MPEAKVVKNRAHLHVFTSARDEARERLLGPRARLIKQQQNCIGSHCN